MALFSISYDLHNEGTTDYQKLWDALEKFKAVRVLESTWAFTRVNTSAKGLRDYFQGFVHKKDSLFVTEVTDWASQNALDNPPNPGD